MHRLSRSSLPPLYIASLTGSDTVVSCILSNEPEISNAEGIYGSALYAAAGKGFARVVTLLLDFGVPAFKALATLFCIKVGGYMRCTSCNC
ncbi:uncharacterized protein BDV17DRAFT_248703 [Aspergillus undulatus]|uniref:uncharacterized protein n=1 Tax=Aspergillus undulatus TaxID=1810928 RepID=UPI003CCD157B